MAGSKKQHLIIPIFLNLILLAGVPFFKTPAETGAKLILVIFGLALPWIVHYVIGNIITSQQSAKEEQPQKEENTDFV